MTGETVSHFTITEKIGAGGMGEVYRARDARLQRDVAVKILPRDYAEDPSRVRRFQQEAAAAGRLNHPNIVTIFDVGLHEGRPFLVTELLDGETLRERLRRGPVAPDEAVGVLRQIVAGLAAAHAEGIVHRDLKPENLFVTTAGLVKILDFGIAKVLWPGVDTEDTTLTGMRTPTTSPGALLGTVGYMAPEQLRGAAVDARADIFSLGAILHELVCGRRAFRGESAADVISAVLREDPDVPEQLAAWPGLVAIRARCLAKAPDDRYPAVEALATALEQPRDGAGSPPPPQSSIATPGAGPTPTSNGPSVAVLPFADMSADQDQGYFCEGIAEELINALTQIAGLRVASRMSSFLFKTAADVREVGSALGVATVVQGSVRKVGDRVRITAQLVDVGEGYQVWSKRFDRKLTDIFEVQDEIADALVGALELELAPGDRPRPRADPTPVMSAYETYLRGRQLFFQGAGSSLANAREAFHEAIRQDPDYAAAHAGLAEACSFSFLYGEPSQELRRQAESASLRAVQLAPDLAEAHSSRGLALSLGGDYPGAATEFDKALELNPRLFDARYLYARVKFAQGDFAMSARLFERALELRPDDVQTPALLAKTYRRLGAAEKALSACRTALSNAEHRLQLIPDDPRSLCVVACCLIELQDRDRGLAIAARVRSLTERDTLGFYVACGYARAGEAKAALERLEAVVASGFAHLDWVRADPDLDSLRDDPQFVRLVGEIERRVREALS